MLGWAAWTGLAQAGVGCRFLPVAVEPAAPGEFALYRGVLGSLSLEFRNEKRDGEVSVFPESPLVLRDVQTGKRCEIDGGVWVRNAVYLSDDARVLMLQEFSGSSDQLVFHRTTDCRRMAALDISGAQWSLRDDGLQLQRPAAAGRPARSQFYRFNARCLPQRPNGARAP